MDTEKGQYEEQLVRWAHTTSDVDVKAARETALKLFAVSMCNQQTYYLTAKDLSNN